MRVLFIYVFCFLLFNSCGSSLNVTSQPYKLQVFANKENNNETNLIVPQGIVYYLPKNLIKVDITYSIKEYTRIVNGRKNPHKYEVVFSKPIVVTSELVPDDTRAFVIDGKRLSNSFWLKSVLDFNLFPNGLVQSVTSDIEDQTFELAKNVVMTSGELAKTFVSPIGIPQGFKNVSEALSVEESIEEQILSSLSTNQFSNPSKISYDNIQDFALRGFSESQGDSISLWGNKVSSVFDFLESNEVEKDALVQNIRDKTKIKKRDENYYLGAINGFNDKIISAKKKQDVDFLKSQIEHFRKELGWFNENNKIDEKSYEINFSVVIDPFHEYKQSEDGKGLNTKKEGNIYRHMIKPSYLFDHLISKFNKKDETPNIDVNASMPILNNENFQLPSVEVLIEKTNLDPNNSKQFTLDNSVDGIIVRQPIQTQIKLLINGSLITSSAVNIAQLGYESIIPLNSIKGGKIQTNLTFDNATGALTNHKITNIKSSIDQSKDLLTATQTSITGAYDYLKYDKPTKELQKLIDQKTKLDALNPSENNILQGEITLIKTQMEFLSLKNELKNLIESLEQKQEELEEDK